MRLSAPVGIHLLALFSMPALCSVDFAFLPPMAGESHALRTESPGSQAADLCGVSGTATLSFDRFYIDQNYGGNGKPGCVRAGDIDDDGDVDIVAGGGQALFVYENNGGARGWARYGNLDGTGQIGCNGAAPFDADGDGDLDVVAVKYRSNLGWWENPGGALGNTAWAFRKLGGGVDGWFAHDILCADLDEDGEAREIIFNLQQGYWDAPVKLLWYTPGTEPKSLWKQHVIVNSKACPNNNHAGLDMADIDQDGNVDLVFSNGWFESPDDPTQNSWTWHKVSDIYGISNSLARDVDGDDDLDLIMAAGHHGSGVYWFANPGDPKSGEWKQQTIDADVHHPEGLQALDLDGDKNLDIIAAELFFGEEPGEPAWNDEAHNIYVYRRMDGDAPQWEKTSIAADSYASHQLQLADINRDRRLDILSEGCGYKIVSYYENSSTGIGEGATWYVDGSVLVSGDGQELQTAFETIQEGLDAAYAGDIVIVSQGTYVENIHFNGKNAVLRSTYEGDWTVVENTVIDGNGSGPVVSFAGMESEACVLSGFTIRNGGPGIRGGARDRHGNATIQYNVITGNSDSGVQYCDGTIENNIISRNKSVEGGGLYDCHGPILGNVITGNVAEFDDGGGLYDCDGLIANNTIVGNTAIGTGGGVYFCDGSIRNCIIWGNRAAASPQIHMEGGVDPRPFVRHSCVEGWTDGDGNLGADPAFVKSGNWDDNDTPDNSWYDVWIEGDHRLSTDSPCIDAGDNASLDQPGLDLDGNLRIAFGGNSITVDMGAYEYDSRPFAETEVSVGDGEGIELRWSGIPNQLYCIEYKNDLATGDWIDAQGAAASSPSDSIGWTDTNTPSRSRSYRIKVERP